VKLARALKIMNYSGFNSLIIGKCAQISAFEYRHLLALAVLLIAVLTTACGRSSDACPVCNMKVKPSDPWSAEIVYKDGSKLMFESPGDLMTFYSAPDRFDVTDAQKNLSNAERILVKDYHSRSQVEARGARFVYQSKVHGPMGRDLVPFADESAALAFVEANGGTMITFEQVTPDMVRNLRRN